MRALRQDMKRGTMQTLRSDEEERAGFNRWLTYLRLNSEIPDNPEIMVDPNRFPSHYALFGRQITVSPEFKALLDRTSLEAGK